MTTGPSIAMMLIELILAVLPVLGFAVGELLPKRLRNKALIYTCAVSLVGLVICSILDFTGTTNGAMIVLAPILVLFYVVIPFGAWCFSFVCDLPERDERRRAAKANTPSDADA